MLGFAMEYNVYFDSVLHRDFPCLAPSIRLPVLTSLARILTDGIQPNPSRPLRQSYGSEPTNPVLETSCGGWHCAPLP